MYFSKLLLRDLFEFAGEKGADEERLGKRFGLKKTEPIGFSDYVSYHVMDEALNLIAKELNDANLGLHIGEKLILHGKKQVDEIMKQSSSVEDAFFNAVNYSKLISDALKSSMIKDKGFTKILFEVNPNWVVFSNLAVRQIIDLTLVCTLKSIYWLTNKSYFPYEVHLARPSIKNRNEYYRIFDCPIKFNESVPCIIFRNPVLSQNILGYTPGLLGKLKKSADQSMKVLKSDPQVVINIKKIILHNLPEKIQINSVAQEINLSARTLQRRLTELNTSFKKIEKEILLQLAKKLLLQRGSKVDEISYLLGYSESSAMIRFFKNETRLTPKKYQDISWNKIKAIP